ncbi:MAG: nucleotidyl transferase AbiEii/AbiGii toxin family protein [Patescibacteria group bacterium]
MHEEIFTDEQRKLLPLVKYFSKDFSLVGGTAVALQIGHRLSVDFDLFTEKDFDNGMIADQINKVAPIEKVQTDQEGQYTLYINGVQFTFMKYRFKIPYDRALRDIIKMPDLVTLGAMKLHALGRRAKWKDYVDLYFIIKDYHSIPELIARSRELFGNEVNETDMRAQLQYFHFMNYSDKVVYMPGFETPGDRIKEQLTLWATS